MLIFLYLLDFFAHRFPASLLVTISHSHISHFTFSEKFSLTSFFSFFSENIFQFLLVFDYFSRFFSLTSFFFILQREILVYFLTHILSPSLIVKISHPQASPLSTSENPHPKPQKEGIDSSIPS